MIILSCCLGVIIGTVYALSLFLLRSRMLHSHIYLYSGFSSARFLLLFATLFFIFKTNTVQPVILLVSSLIIYWLIILLYKESLA